MLRKGRQLLPTLIATDARKMNPSRYNLYMYDVHSNTNEKGIMKYKGMGVFSLSQYHNC